MMVTLDDFFYDDGITTIPPPIIQPWEVNGVKPGLFIYPRTAGIAVPLFKSLQLVGEDEECYAPVVAPPLEMDLNIPFNNGFVLRGFIATRSELFHITMERTVVPEDFSQALTVRFCYTANKRGEIQGVTASYEFHASDLTPEVKKELNYGFLGVEIRPQGLYLPEGKLTIVDLHQPRKNRSYVVEEGKKVWTTVVFPKTTPIEQQQLKYDPLFDYADVCRDDDHCHQREEEIDVRFVVSKELDLAETMHALFVAAGENSAYSTRQAQIGYIAQLMYLRWKDA